MVRIRSLQGQSVTTVTFCLLLLHSGGTQRLPRLVGVSKAKEMIFTGKMISGTEAAEIGLADYAVEQNEAGDAAYQRALTLAEEILPRGPVAVKMAKLAINKGIQVSLIMDCNGSRRDTPATPLPLFKDLQLPYCLKVFTHLPRFCHDRYAG